MLAYNIWRYMKILAERSARSTETVRDEQVLTGIQDQYGKNSSTPIC